MAGNVETSPGQGGAVVATDRIDGVDYQRTKVVWGVDGVAVDTSASNPMPVSPGLPRVATATNTSATTAADGSGWVAFPAAACTAMRIINTATNAAAIEYRRGGGGVAINVPAETDAPILGITNANQIQVRRVDQSTAQQLVYAEVYA